MGIVNVTPDSFSDGGKYLDTAAAIRHGEQLAAQGADIVDVGGESTRPGAERVDAETEANRVVPVVRALVKAGITVSVDTMRASTAQAALSAGAHIINDVSGGLADPEMATVVSAHDCSWVLMHWRGHSATMQSATSYRDVTREVIAHLGERIDAVRSAGVRDEQIIVDPGLGFAKTAQHNWVLLAELDEFAQLGFPLLIGASRKSFLAALGTDRTVRPAPERDAASLAVSLYCARRDVWAVRVHDVAGTVDAFAVMSNIDAAGRLSPQLPG
ncbi:MAG: dihydropteroate synthase [Corynebacteriales bacterium]|nr:dihydropteroate synthase [Mycobacteriales bacterium]